jgi:PAS domain S-box-containing protein
MINNFQRDDRLLTQILEIGSSLHRNLTLDTLLQEIAQMVHDSLGFGAVVLNLVDEDSKQVRVCAYVGLDDEGRQLLEGAVYAWEDFDHLLQERFRVGRCYFVPQSEFDWERDFEGPVYRAADDGLSSDDVDDRWRSDDSLFVPIQLRPGQMLGILSVDQPLDGRRPSPETLQALEIFANQAAIAIENARLYEQAQQEIGERKQVEEALKRLSSIVEQTTDPVVITDKDGIIEYVNSAFEKLTGYAKEEAIGQTPRIVKSGEHDQKFYEELWRTILSGDSYRGVVVNRKKTGEVFYEEKSITPLRDEQGIITHFVSTGKDITERKTAEVEREQLLAKAQQSERLLRSIIDATPDWIFVKDQEHRFRLVNQGFAESLHLRPEDLIDKDDLELGFPEELVKGDPEKGIRGFWADDRQVMDSGEPMVIPYDLVTVDDELRVLNTIKTPLRDADGKIWGVLGFGRDVTQRERLLADLARRSTQLQTAAEVSRAVSSILNPDELMRQVVNLVRERFELYYAGLFLVDQAGEWTGEAGRWAVLRAGTGEAGRIQLERSHKLEIGGESMVGWCVANKQARIALDVGEEAVRFENPLLPETRSEMALPLIVRGKVIGAMTVQSTQESAFSDEDVAVLQTMADQLAVAIENARLFEQAQARAERERLVRTITNRVHQGADAEAIMRITLQELGQILGATQSVIRLGTREQLLSIQEARASKTEGA